MINRKCFKAVLGRIFLSFAVALVPVVCFYYFNYPTSVLYFQMARLLKGMIVAIGVGSVCFGFYYHEKKSPWFLDSINPGLSAVLILLVYFFQYNRFTHITLVDIGMVCVLPLGSWLLIGLIRKSHEFLRKDKGKISYPFKTLSIVFFSLLFSLWFSLLKAREQGLKIACVGNLKNIGLSLRLYSNVFGDDYPERDGAAGFEQLRSTGFLENRICYVCPDYRIHHPELTNTNWRMSNNKPLTEDTVGYIYIGGMGEATSVDSSCVMDKPFNHDRYGNILFIDGHVKGYAGADWMMNAGLNRKKINRLLKRYRVLEKKKN